MFIVSAKYKTEEGETKEIFRVLPEIPAQGDVVRADSCLYKVAYRSIVTAKSMQDAIDSGKIAVHAKLALEFVKRIEDEFELAS